MDDIIAGCCKVFGAILLVGGGFVILVVYAFHGAVWALHHLAIWWGVHGGQVIAGTITLLVLLVVAIFAGVGLSVWWQTHQANAQRRSALRQLDRKYQQAAAAIDNTGDGRPVVPGVIPPARRAGRRALP
jgi:hypothetical protein